ENPIAPCFEAQNLDPRKDAGAYPRSSSAQRRNGDVVVEIPIVRAEAAPADVLGSKARPAPTYLGRREHLTGHAVRVLQGNPCVDRGEIGFGPTQKKVTEVVHA